MGQATFHQKSVNMQENLDHNGTIGHKMLHKEDQNIRIFMINSNGISMNNDAEQYQEICDHMNQHNTDFFSCLEHNLDTTQHTVQYNMKNITHAAFSLLSLQLSSSPIPMFFFTNQVVHYALLKAL